MREEHPIDERFSALYDAESTPPEAVRNALGAKLGWSGTSAGWGLWRPWLIAASTVVVLSMIAGHVFKGTEPSQADRTAEARTTQHQTSTSDRGDDEQDTIELRETAGSTSPESAEADPSGNGINTTTPGTQDVATRSDNVNGGSDTSSISQQSNISSRTPHQAAVEPDRSRTEAGATNTASSDPGSAPGDIKRQAREAGTGSTQNSGVSEGSASTAIPETPSFDARADAFALPDANALPMLPLPLAIDPALAEGLPLSASPRTPYVLPHGSWWLAPYVSMGPVSGQWKGGDSNDLRDSEKWHSSTQGGVLAGRSWRSGWSVSAGLGLSRIRSSFAYNGTNGTEEYTEVDTAWTATPYADTPYTVYTWNIDSLITSRPGAIVHRNARNQYTAVQIPLILSWHRPVRRFECGAFGGITAWIPTQRSGLTLVRPSPDALPSVAELSDPNADARFRAQVHGRLGLSVGYAITELLDIYAEPMISTPLMVFDENAPRLTQPVLQLRLQYEFPTTR